MGSDANNLIAVPITPYNDTTLQNVTIGLINCQSICNKSDELSDVGKNMEFDNLVIKNGYAGYSFQYVARTLLRDSLKCETHLRFLAKSFENCQLTFVSVGISVRVCIMYRLHPTKEMA